MLVKEKGCTLSRSCFLFDLQIWGIPKMKSTPKATWLQGQGQTSIQTCNSHSRRGSQRIRLEWWTTPRAYDNRLAINHWSERMSNFTVDSIFRDP